uniref:Uncharacterized protein n=1 Tax=Arundo donax TaxID=35708 RepID=A0A0A9EH23_ARUDO
MDRKAIFFISCCLSGVLSHLGDIADFEFEG